METHSSSSEGSADREPKSIPSQDGNTDNLAAIEFHLDETLARFGGDRELFVEMVECFLTDSPAMIDQMRKGIEQNNLTAAGYAAHRLKGTVGYFGVAPLVATAQSIEQAGKAADRDRVVAGVERLTDQVASLRRLLAPYCESHTG